MRSVVVVLPASICAMMPMFRVFSSGNASAINLDSPPPAQPGTYVLARPYGPLEPVMCEGPIGLCHAVRVLPFLDSCPNAVRRVEEFACQLLRHGLAGSSAC